MTFERYQELLKSNTCYQINNNNSLLLLSRNRKLLIEINCLPQIVDMEDLEKDANQRILLFVYPSTNVHPELKVSKALSDRVTILTDCENSDAAVGYELSIDENNEEVILKLSDFPKVGKELLSEKEVIGIHKKLWKPQSVLKH